MSLTGRCDFMSRNVVELPESLRSIVNAVEDIRHALNKTCAHTRELDDALGTITYELERQASVQERTSRELQQLKNTLAQMKALMGAQAVTDIPQDSAAVHIAEIKEPVPMPGNKLPPLSNSDTSDSNSSSDSASSFWSSGYSFPDNASARPVMNGSGFSQVTWSYLRKLNDRK